MNKPVMSGISKLFILTTAVTLLFLGGIAHALTVDYTVVGWGPTHYPAATTPPAGAPWGTNGYPGDTLQLVTYTGSLNLTPGTYTQKINTLLWTIDYTYGGTATNPGAWSNLSFNVTAPRNMSFDGGSTGSLSQAGLLEVTWFYDAIAFSNGTKTSFLVNGYQVDVIPLGFAMVTGGDLGPQSPIDIMARFDVTAVPEPGTLMLLGFGLVGLVAAGRKRQVKG